MIFVTMTLRVAVIGVALVAALVGVLAVLIGSALNRDDAHLAVFDDDLGDDALALFEAAA